MKHNISKQDMKFKKRFESCEFPLADFDHRAHLRLAYVYLVDNDTETAVKLMRKALLDFLEKNGVDSSKYHVTMTQAWILAVQHFMHKTDSSVSAEAFIEQHPQMLDAKIMLTHYSAEVLFSEEARKHFVQPNLDPIPKYSE